MSGESHFRTRTGPAFALVLLMIGLLLPAARASDAGSLDTQKSQVVTVVTQNGNQTSPGVGVLANSAVNARGLMLKTQLPEQQGMLFDFGRDQKIRMWMKNTLIPLDTIFIQSERPDARTKQEEGWDETPASSDHFGGCDLPAMLGGVFGDVMLLSPN